MSEEKTDFIRNEDSKALINNNKAAFDAYKKNRNIRLKQKNEINIMKEEIKVLTKEVKDIKKLLMSWIDRHTDDGR